MTTPKIDKICEICIKNGAACQSLEWGSVRAVQGTRFRGDNYEIREWRERERRILATEDTEVHRVEAYFWGCLPYPTLSAGQGCLALPPIQCFPFSCLPVFDCSHEFGFSCFHLMRVLASSSPPTSMTPTTPSWRASAGGNLFLAIVRSEPADFQPANGEDIAEAWRLAKTHGMVPLFSDFVLAHPAWNWPPDIRDEAKKMSDFALFRNVQLLAMLGKIQKALEGRGIPWISMKGPVFTEQYAGSPTLRLSGDLDVLVHPQDAMRVDSVFREMGITCRNPIRPHTRWLGIQQHEHSYYSSAPRFLIELHWSLASECYEIVSSDMAFRRARRAKVDAGLFPVLSPEDTLLFAAMHSLGHRWSHFYHVKNLDWILHETLLGRTGQKNARTLDWDYILYAAAKTRKTRSLLLGLSLAHEELGAKLPDSILHQIESDSTLPTLRDLVAENFRGAGPEKSSWRTLLFKWRALESGRDRTELFLRALVTRTVWRR